MEWVKEPENVTYGAETRDSCSFRFCWSREDDGPCGLNVCITKFCYMQY